MATSKTRVSRVPLGYGSMAQAPADGQVFDPAPDADLQRHDRGHVAVGHRQLAVLSGRQPAEGGVRGDVDRHRSVHPERGIDVAVEPGVVVGLLGEGRRSCDEQQRGHRSQRGHHGPHQASRMQRHDRSSSRSRISPGSREAGRMRSRRWPTIGSSAILRTKGGPVALRHQVALAVPLTWQL